MRHTLMICLAVLAITNMAFADTVKPPSPAARLRAVEGVVDLRPEQGTRWTPAEDGQEVLPGDEIRCGARGANGVSVTLAAGGEVVLGPGGLMRLEPDGKLHLSQGELAVLKQGPGTPKEGSWRAGKGAVRKLEKAPAWLDGFVNLNPREAMGALLASVDGREVSLSLGYHKVTVDVRDQIARTVIEESFVNHTDETLEGVFQFPLPQDASISNFGMWIGDRLVEADVVEKQRAREIYETIKREKRDPGLLEWAGGSLFKARVYPIPPHAEKRVTITYTQVLPLRRGAWSWDYALRSDLLQAHPLKTLELDIRVHSDAGLEQVTCPTHDARIETTAQGARVRFEAQEYRPDRDFRVVVTPKPSRSGVRAVTHRRGDDGYFMVLFQPPETEASGDRNLLPDGEPLELLIMADTSGSMGPDQRRAQEDFIRALLGSLRPEDRFRIAACDVACSWAAPDFVMATPSNRDQALGFLSARESLGWTDLDVLVQAALGASSEKTHLIYVGDGRHSAGDADTMALAARLSARGEIKAASIHAVAPGNQVEPSVMLALAALGGGSYRQLRDDDGARYAARDLLREILVPGLRNLRISFEGFKAAKVYPEVLPNLAAGTQQVVVGRYLPGEGAKKGRIIIQGEGPRGAQKWSEAVRFADADRGNSFLPRLWARLYLDELLRSGDSDLKERIVGFSQEFRIMTPFTSFLVLESDGDRARFGVKRHFQMRDGEEFFAEGRARTDFALARKAMKQAGTWRARLHGLVLSSMEGMGRDLLVVQEQTLRGPAGSASFGWGRGGGAMDDGIVGDLKSYDFEVGGDLGQELDRTVLEESETATLPMSRLGVSKREVAAPERVSSDAPFNGLDIDGNGWAQEKAVDGRFLPSAGESLPAEAPMMADELMASTEAYNTVLAGKDKSGLFDYRSSRSRSAGRRQSLLKSASLSTTVLEVPLMNQAWWFQRLAGYISDPPAAAPSPTQQEPVPEALKAISALLYRGGTLSPEAALEIRRTTRSFSPVRGTITSETEETAVLAGTRWIHWQSYADSDARLSWCDGEEYVVGVLPFDLGWRRAAGPDEGARIPLSLNAFLLNRLDQAFPGYSVGYSQEGKSRPMLTLWWSPPAGTPGAQENEMHLFIDEARGVVLEMSTRYGAQPEIRTLFSDFVQVRGAWWPGRTVTLDGSGRKISEVRIRYKALSKAGLAEAGAAAAAALSDALLFHHPLPAVDEARERSLTKAASSEDLLTLLLTDGLLQRWELAFRHLDALDALHPSAPGLRWVRLALEVQARRHQEMKERLLSLADRVVRDRGPQAWSRTRYLFEQGPQGLQAHEIIELLDVLEPIYTGRPEWSTAYRTFVQSRVSWLRNAGRTDAADAEERALVERYPHDYNVIQQYCWSLRNSGDISGAIEALKGALATSESMEVWERSSLRNQWAQFLIEQGHLEEALALIDGWMGDDGTQTQLYDQYLSLLVRTGNRPKAKQVIQGWLAQDVGKPLEDTGAQARLQAAVNLMLGQGLLYTYTVEKDWVPVLTDLAIRLGPTTQRSWMVTQIINHQGVIGHGADRVIRAAWLELLEEEMSTLDAAAVQFLAGQLAGREPTVSPETWRALAKAASQRMDGAAAAPDRHLWSDVVVSLLAQHVDLVDELLRFLRERYSWTGDAYRAQDRDTLFYVLLRQDWSPALETELLSLALTFIGESETANPTSRVPALQSVTRWMHFGRVTQAAKTWADREDLTRNLQRSLRLAAARAGHEDVARVLLALEGPSPIQDWIAMEIAYHEILGGAAAGPIAARCRSLIQRGEILKPKTRALEILRERILLTLEYLATRRDAAPALARDLLDLIDHELDARTADRYWRTHKARLLMALDRPEALEASLKAWQAAGVASPAWRRLLGYLAAETGRISEAIEQFEALRGSGQLTGNEWATLADWYLVEGRRADRAAASLERFLAVPEYELSNLYGVKSSRLGVTGAIEVDDEILMILKALLRKSQYPANYVWQVQSLYQQTRDPRVLGVLAEGIQGHSPGRLYPVLENLHYIFQEIQDEASVDAAVAAIDGARKTARTAVDVRALDLLLVAAERRAAELINQPGPHGERALAALARAEKGAWQEGEPRLMAGFIAGLGHLSWEKLARAQRRSLRALVKLEPPGSEDHLAISSYLAATRWSYGKQASAINELLAAVDVYLGQRDGVLSSSYNHVVESLIGYMEASREHLRAEALLGRIEEHATNAGQRWWAHSRALRVQAHALQAGAAASLGTGVALYEALLARLYEELATQPPLRSMELVSTLTGVFWTARDKHFGDVAGELKRFVRDYLPAVLEAQTNDLQNIIGVVADSLHNLVNAREALAFLVERLEQEPDWAMSSNQSGWNWHGYRLGNLRREAGPLGALEQRLFALVAAQLRRELETRQRSNAVLYHLSYGDFWRQKADAFAKITLDFISSRSDDGALLEYAARYLWEGLGRHDDAITVLADAWARGLLSEQGGRSLVDYLFAESRYGDAVPVIQYLLELHPMEVHLNAQLSEALCRTGRRAEHRKQLQAIEATLARDKAWVWSAQTEFAGACQRCGDWKEAVRLYELGIDGYMALGRRRPGGDPSLSAWFSGLAEAYAGLDDTAGAVDAASGAVVAWGSNQSQRQAALGTLAKVLKTSKDLDGYMKTMERVVEETGLENPTVRRALGIVLMDKGRDADALKQLEKAIEVSPWDPEIRDAVVELHRRNGRFAEAARACIHACRARPVEPTCWGRVEDLYKQAGDAFMAERARTNVIEAAPDELGGSR